jgi:hypothetical protein
LRGRPGRREGGRRRRGAAVAAVVVPHVPAAAALLVSGEGVNGRAEGERRRLWNQKLNPSIYLFVWILTRSR